MSHVMSVLSVRTRNVLVSPRGATSPVSSANGTPAASMLPQVAVTSTVSSPGCSCANRKSSSTPGASPRLTMPTLLVSGCAPPRPSIWRLSGEPITASSTRSRVAGSAGRSPRWKNGPREVPPRMNRHGMARWACMSTRPGHPPGPEELLERLATKRRDHLGIRHAGRPREFLEAEEARAVVHRRAPVAVAEHALLLGVEAGGLHRVLGVVGEPLARLGRDQRVQEAIDAQAARAALEIEDVWLRHGHSNSATAIAVVIGR